MPGGGKSSNPTTKSNLVPPRPLPHPRPAVIRGQRAKKLNQRPPSTLASMQGTTDLAAEALVSIQSRGVYNALRWVMVGMCVEGVCSSGRGGSGAGVIAERRNTGFEVLTRAVQCVRKHINLGCKAREERRTRVVTTCVLVVAAAPDGGR